MKHAFTMRSIAMLWSATVPDQTDATWMHGAILDVVLGFEFCFGNFLENERSLQLTSCLYLQSTNDSSELEYRFWVMI